MIIAACNDDQMVEDIARNASQQHHATFGDWYKIFAAQIPDAGQHENLFIVAHGAAFGDENKPVIGNKTDDFYLTARDLNANMHVYPSGYDGGVYIYACESAAQGAETSFVEEYKAIVSQSYPNIRVYGQVGHPGGPIPGPNDPSWVEAR